MTELGDCFEVAGRIILASTPRECLVLCHGTPIGTGYDNMGKRYWHAWIETPEGFVIDHSNGGSTRPPIPIPVYYLAGQLDEDHVWRFNHEEARHALTVEHLHYGPWIKEMDGAL